MISNHLLLVVTSCNLQNAESTCIETETLLEHCCGTSKPITQIVAFMIFVVFLHLDTHSAYRSLMILADYQSIDFHNYELSAPARFFFGWLRSQPKNSFESLKSSKVCPYSLWSLRLFEYQGSFLRSLKGSPMSVKGRPAWARWLTKFQSTKAQWWNLLIANSTDGIRHSHYNMLW